MNQTPPSQPSYPISPQDSQQGRSKPSSYGDVERPPENPVFGVSLEELFARDGSAVPMVVYQCLQAVDLFGLDVEGIYRLSGNAKHIAKLQSIFNHGMVF